MISIKSNSNTLIKDQLKKKEFQAQLLSSAQNYRNNYQNVFSNTFQNLVTKLGLIVSDCSNDKKMSVNTYLGSIDFLCLKVLDNKTCHNVFKALGVNQKSNANKHSILKTDDLDLNVIVTQYNLMLNLIAKKYNLSSILAARIEVSKVINPFEEKKSVKYENLSGNLVELRLSPFYRNDPYNKVVQVDLTFFINKASKDRLIVKIRNSHRTLSDFELDLDNQTGKYVAKLEIGKSDVKFASNGSVFLDISVGVSVKRLLYVAKMRQKGLIFKRMETYYVYEWTIVDTYEISLKQHLKEEMKN